MPYRTMGPVTQRSLSVQNHPTLTSVVASGIGVTFALSGCGLLAASVCGAFPLGGEVVTSATATVLVLAGLGLAAVGLRMMRSRTFFALDRDQLTVTIRAGHGPVSRHVVHVEDIERVGLEIGEGAGATFRTQIVLRGKQAIVLGDASTSGRAHYERVAEQIRLFLRQAGETPLP